MNTLSKIYQKFNSRDVSQEQKYENKGDSKNEGSKTLLNEKVKESEIIIPNYTNSNKKEREGNSKKQFFTPNNQVFRNPSPDSLNLKLSLKSPNSLRNIQSYSSKKSDRKISSEPEDILPRELSPKPIERESNNFIQEILKKKLEIKQQIKYLDDQIIMLEDSVNDKDFLFIEKVEEIKGNLNDLFLSDIEQEKKPEKANTPSYGKKKATSKKSPIPKKKVSKSNEPKSSYKEKSKRSPDHESKFQRIPIHERNKQWEREKQDKLLKERVKILNNFRKKRKKSKCMSVHSTQISNLMW